MADMFGSGSSASTSKVSSSASGRPLPGVRKPGLTWIKPVHQPADQSQHADRGSQRAAQETITRDNVTLKVDAVVY